jgi:hypothetical protein
VVKVESYTTIGGRGWREEGPPVQSSRKKQKRESRR